MKIFFLNFIFIFSLIESKAQSNEISTITILGIDNYIEQSNGQQIIFTFEEDLTKCDPIKGTTRLEEQIALFEGSFKMENLPKTGLEELFEPNFNSSNRSKKYKFVSPNQNEISKIFEICTKQGISIQSQYYVFPSHSFENEDKNAINAYKNALERAQIIAAAIGKKIIGIHKVDDETTFTTFEDSEDFDEEKSIAIMELYSNLGLSNAYSNLNSSPTKEGAYSLLVTFEIK